MLGTGGGCAATNSVPEPGGLGALASPLRNTQPTSPGCEHSRPLSRIALRQHWNRPGPGPRAQPTAPHTAQLALQHMEYLIDISATIPPTQNTSTDGFSGADCDGTLLLGSGGIDWAAAFEYTGVAPVGVAFVAGSVSNALSSADAAGGAVRNTQPTSSDCEHSRPLSLIALRQHWNRPGPGRRAQPLLPHTAQLALQHIENLLDICAMTPPTQNVTAGALTATALASGTAWIAAFDKWLWTVASTTGIGGGGKETGGGDRATDGHANGGAAVRVGVVLTPPDCFPCCVRTHLPLTSRRVMPRCLNRPGPHQARGARRIK